MSTIPRCIEVIRDSEGVAAIVVDGQELPWALFHGKPLEVIIGRENPPTVTLTLVAHSVLVSDELLADEDLNAAQDAHNAAVHSDEGDE